MAMNEFRLSTQNDSHSLRTSRKTVAFKDQDKETALSIFDQRVYSQFHAYPAPRSQKDETDSPKEVSHYSVFVPIDRLRLSWIDALLFYPFVILSTLTWTEMFYGLNFKLFGGMGLFDWYIPFFEALTQATSPLVENTYANAFAVFAPFDSLITVPLTILAYLLFKFFLSWLPSLIWKWIIGWFLKP
jgi:hypothetical protein